MITRTQYENAARQYLRQNPKDFERYYSPSLLKTLVDAMQSSLPTQIAASIAFDRLVANGQLQRTDGRTAADDRLEAIAAAEANLNAVIGEVDATPLSRAELEYFGSLSQKELREKYWEDNSINQFAIRYRRANREFMFQIPSRPVAQQESEQGGEVELTAAQYHAISSIELKRRLQQPNFKAAVERLAERGEI
jgi:hypothetical protein